MKPEPRWDHYSDQPYRLAADAKPGLDSAALLEYLKTLATAIGLSPAILWRYLTIKPRIDIDQQGFVGLSISSRTQWRSIQHELVDELGVKNLLLRIPSWHADRLDDYLRVLELFPNHRFIVNLLQNHDSVRQPATWAQQADSIIQNLPQQVNAVQIANAVNRKKWGCRHTGDYLLLQQELEAVRKKHSGIKFLGSSVIDFEPLSTLRSVFNLYQFKIDGVASELYVNRRGSPYSRQLLVFNLNRKIRLLSAIASVSNRSTSKLWITETNWPLLNTRPYTPNSGHPRSTVDETTQARYLTEFYRIAWQSRQIQAVYWWQLINPGYGLIDHRGGSFRKMPSFDAFKAVVHGKFTELD